MRVNRVLALTASVALAFGLAACGSDSSDDDTKSSSAPAAEDTAKDANAEDAKDAEDDGDDAGSANGDFCATAINVYDSFDTDALANGDPAALRDVAASFREVAESADGDAKTAWEKYADYIDVAADVLENPTDMDNMTKMQEISADASTWITQIADSIAACS